MKTVQKLGDIECYTPLSDHFRFYKYNYGLTAFNLLTLLREVTYLKEMTGRNNWKWATLPVFR
jgi:hypothetical protein